MTNLPSGIIGAASAAISFMAIGIPLYKHGVSMPLCILAQLGVMALLIFSWLQLTQTRYYRAVNGKAQVRHGRFGHWEDLDEHMRSHD